MKRVIRASEELNEYTVTVNFGSYIGADNDYIVYAKSQDEAVEQALEDARCDVTADDITEVDDGEWEVTCSFCGMIGVEETYTVYADDEDEAEQLALEEAYDDLDGEIASEEEDD